jgi:hypothetical protein
MRAVDIATVLIRVVGIVALVFGFMCLTLFLVALIVLGGPLKLYEPLTEGVISYLAGRAILYLVFGFCLTLPSRRLARFAAKFSGGPVGYSENQGARPSAP